MIMRCYFNTQRDVPLDSGTADKKGLKVQTEKAWNLETYKAESRAHDLLKYMKDQRSLVVQLTNILLLLILKERRIYEVGNLWKCCPLASLGTLNAGGTAYYWLDSNKNRFKKRHVRGNKHPHFYAEHALPQLHKLQALLLMISHRSPISTALITNLPSLRSVVSGLEKSSIQKYFSCISTSISRLLNDGFSFEA